jgi:D-alanine-D-alanine ligase
VIRVGIFMGGPSLEKEVSFNSGRTICDHLDRESYIPIPLFISVQRRLFILPWQFLYRGKISDFENRLELEATEIYWQDLKHIIDFAYLALHGFLGEDGNIQGLLTVFSIPFSGSMVLTNALCINKKFILDLLGLYKIDVPKEISVSKNSLNISQIEENFFEKHKKIIVKPQFEGSSFGISVINNKNELWKAIEFARNINQEFKQDVVLQEYLAGVEFSIIALEKEGNWIIFDPTEIVSCSDFFSYNQKYLPGSISKFTPGRFSNIIKDRIKSILKQIIDIINPYDIIRVDGIIDLNDLINIIDVNTFPGTAPSSFVFLQGSLYGLSPVVVINTIIENALLRYNLKNLSFNKKKIIQKNEYKIKVGVLLGGNSNEKEISLESGRNVYYKLSSNYFEAYPIFVSQNERYYILQLDQVVKDTTLEIEKSLKNDQEIEFSKINILFDFIFIGLHGGNGENGFLQKQLEELGIPFNGSGSTSSSLCMNKLLTLNRLDDFLLNTTCRKYIKKNNRIYEDEYSFFIMLLNIYKMVIIKPNDDGCSAFVFLAKTLDQIEEGITVIFNNFKDSCLIEGCINGIELTVGIIGNQDDFLVLPITQTMKTENILSIEEKFLPGAGENITPAPFDFFISNRIKHEIRKAYQALGCDGYSRIDCFWIEKDNKLIILECNTLPALTPATCLFHQAAEINIHPGDFISYLVYLGFSKKKCIEKLSQSFLKTIYKIQLIIDENSKNQSVLFDNKTLRVYSEL